MTIALNQNQFGIQPIKGMLDLKFNFNTISCEVDSGESGSLVPGQAVTLVDSQYGIPKVIGATADTDVVFGFVTYAIKNASYVSGDAVEISQAGNVMYMESSEAISRGAKVMIVPTGVKVATATSGKPVSGWAFDKASASAQLIRVHVTTPAFTTA